MAQLAKMSTEAFEDFYFDVTTIDYPALEKAMEPLKARMEQANDVHITGPGTDLRFSIENIPVIKACDAMKAATAAPPSTPRRSSTRTSLPAFAR